MDIERESEAKSMDIKDAEMGMEVYYVPNHARGDVAHRDVERGVISSVNGDYIFVKFKTGTSGLACRPDNVVKVKR